jgi:hypothetical protein
MNYKCDCPPSTACVGKPGRIICSNSTLSQVKIFYNYTVT